jgi:sugar lactone lactonase YvrE
MWWAVACSGDDGGWRAQPDLSSAHSGDPPGHSAVESEVHTAADHSSRALLHTGLSAHSAPDRCVGPPPPPGLVAWVGPAPLSEEFALDAAGDWWGVLEGQGLFRWTLGGEPALVLPYSSGEAAGLRFWPDGRTLALADEAAGAIVAMDSVGLTVTPVLGGLASPNSIGVDAHGDLWIGSYGRFLRLRAGSSTPEVLIDLPYTDLDGVTFSPDERRVWFNGDETGDVWAVDLDAAREVTSVAVQFTMPLYGTQLDGMTTDACGNLYLLETDGKLWRRTPAGVLEPLLGPQFAYASAIAFGSGAGGFDRETLYVMDRASGLYALPIGLEGRPEPHLP